jgi:hypothetical protein
VAAIGVTFANGATTDSPGLSSEATGSTTMASRGMTDHPQPRSSVRWRIGICNAPANEEKESTMKRLVVLLALLGITVATLALGAVKTYQVTGPVLAVTADSIVVQKGSEKWELERDSSTKVTGDLKVGAKVTIEYRMTAATVTVREESAASGKKK